MHVWCQVSAVDDLVALLAAHVDMTDRSATDGCSCGNIDYPHEKHLAQALIAAGWVKGDAVTSDEAVERASYAMYEAHKIDHFSVSPLYPALARAAILAALPPAAPTTGEVGRE